MTPLEEAAALARNERGLVIVANGPVKLANLRARPQVTATFRTGWQWAALEADNSKA